MAVASAGESKYARLGRTPGLSERVTFSAGVVQTPPEGAPLEAILAAADKALYRAKQAGRDRIEVAAGAVYELLSEDKRQAVEIIVAGEAEKRHPEFPDDTDPPERK